MLPRFRSFACYEDSSESNELSSLLKLTYRFLMDVRDRTPEAGLLPEAIGDNFIIFADYAVVDEFFFLFVVNVYSSFESKHLSIVITLLCMGEF